MLPSLSPTSGDTAKSADSAAADSVAAHSSAKNPTTGTSVASPKPSDRAPRSVDFVNLYEVLQMPQESAPADLRKRISVMYLEAQKNQDHRNAQKRMYFQQLYEVYLPQARFLLLEPKRRTEYDQHLTVYREDQAKSVELEEALNAGGTQTTGTQAASVLEPGIEERMTPEELATYRAELWSRWEEGLKQNSGELARLTFSPVELKARAVERQDYIERVMVEVREENRKAEEKRERLRRQEQLQRELEQEKHRAEELKRRRDQVYDENTDDLVARARNYWAIGVGAACFLFMLCLMFVIDVYISTRQPQHNTLRIAGLAITLLAGIIGAWKSKDIGVEKVRKRSVRRKDVQKEAEMLAQTTMAARKPPESERKKFRPEQERKEAEELHDEINRLAKLLHRAAIDDIILETASYGRAFFMGNSIFLMGFVMMFLLNQLTLEEDIALRLIVMVITWITTMVVAFAIGTTALNRARRRGQTDTRITA
ncbi:MAG TPA: hypothetical protein VM821_05700 [Abditibacteriaceae bacterium]|jgi:threonine/homoserine/homoserine lactone efflux protein|nr:hypothetical protein [Abditibacteriaceae bacterium]